MPSAQNRVVNERDNESCPHQAESLGLFPTLCRSPVACVMSPLKSKSKMLGGRRGDETSSSGRNKNGGNEC